MKKNELNNYTISLKHHFFHHFLLPLGFLYSDVIATEGIPKYEYVVAKCDDLVECIVSQYLILFYCPEQWPDPREPPPARHIRFV
jgi:hypothetical protein